MKTLISTAFATVLGLPLGVLLVEGDKNGVMPLPRGLYNAIGAVINLLRSVPFLILMILVFPLTRLIVGTVVGTAAMSGIIGGGGLGKIAINYGYYRYKYLVMVLAVILLVIIAQIFQSIGTRISVSSDKRLK